MGSVEDLSKSFNKTSGNNDGGIFVGAHESDGGDEDRDLRSYAPRVDWSNDVEWQTKWLDEIVDKALHTYLNDRWLVAEPTEMQKLEFMKKIFGNSQKKRYNGIANQTPIVIGGERCGVFGKDYGFFMDDGSKNVGINYHTFIPYYNVPSDKLQILDDRYDIFVDGQYVENMKMCKITFNIDVVREINKSFYIVPGNVIGKKEHYIVKKEDSEKAFLHEQGHNEIVEYCFPEIKGKMFFFISIERPFMGDSKDAVATNAWLWIKQQMSERDENPKPMGLMIKEKIENRFDKINGNKTVNGKDSYYHNIYGNDGSPWNEVRYGK
jgi:hypothetical protein